MQDRELIAIIKSHRRDSLGADDGALSNERAMAFDHYHGRPFGNEVEGRSAVVSRDLSETVDWAMPAIMRVFVQSGNIGEFEPVGPEDEELAQQESDAVNKTVMQDANGFLVIHDAVKDALILKNGYTKQWWEVVEKTTEEEYSGLTIQEITAMLAEIEGQGAAVTIKGQSERTIMVPGPQGEMPIQVFDIRLQVTRKEGKVCLAAVPPEELRVSRKCRGDLAESSFVEHVTRKTRSDLIEMGMPKGFVNSLPSLTGEDNDSESLARDSVTDESDDLDVSLIDRSMDEIEYCEAYIRVDYDGDGIAELRKVVTVADKIPPGEDWNEVIDCVPITGGVPKRIPHRHVGESLDDELSELQEIKTTLLRMALDNGYATLNAQWLVNERVNLPDFLTSLPGGVKRVRGIDPVPGAAVPVDVQPIIGQILPVLDYVDGIKANRTGISAQSTGLDPDILKQSTKGAYLENLNRASQKIEMITRMLAETLVKPMLLQVHDLLIKHQDKPKMMRLRGKFVPVNPQSWRERNDLVVKVGLGTGNNEERLQKLMHAGMVQKELAAVGLVGPMQAYNLATDLFKALGFDMPEKYAMHPQSPEFQQAQQAQGQRKDPLVEAEQVKGQVTLQKAQIDQQGKAQELQAESVLEKERMAMESGWKEREMQMQAELERWKAQLKAETELTIARMREELAHERDMVRAQNEARPVVQLGGHEVSGEIQKHMSGQNDSLAQAFGALTEAMQGLKQAASQMSAPKKYKVRRGMDGRVEGIE